MISDNDIKHLEFIFDRMHFIHGESQNLDYMIRFKEILIKLKNPPVRQLKQAFDAGTSYATYNGRPGFEDAPNFDEWHSKWKRKNLGNRYPPE